MRSAYKLMFASLAIAGLLVSIQPALAHHSGAEFDATKMVEIKGTIKEFQFKNPHTWIQVMVDDGKGKEVEWSLEWGAPILWDVKDTAIHLSTGRKVTMRFVR